MNTQTYANESSSIICFQSFCPNVAKPYYTILPLNLENFSFRYHDNRPTLMLLAEMRLISTFSDAWKVRNSISLPETEEKPFEMSRDLLYRRVLYAM